MIIYLNGEQRQVDTTATLLDILGNDADGGELRRGVAVVVDGSVVPRSSIAETELTEGVRVEIVTAVQGG